jgi:hypothetical protein
MSWSRSLAGLVGVLFVGLAGLARGAGPADELFRLVPPDAGVTLAVEDLSGHAREFLASPLAERLGKLPAVRDWLESDRSRRLRNARREIESALGVDLAAIRDGLLGDAVVLTLHVPPGGRPDQARGLLLVRVRDRPLLDRLIREVNAAQLKQGELLRVVERSRGRTSYSVREFRPGGRATEYYATFPDHQFAWSNSEKCLQGVIDRKGGGAASLHDNQAFQGVRRRLPDRAVASLFVDPGFVRSLVATVPRPTRPQEERAFSMLGRYLGAITYAGAAIERRDGVVLHTEESLDPSKLDPWLKRWASRPVPSESPTRRVPSNALAVLAGHVDFVAILDAVRALVPDAEAGKFDNLLEVARGMLLGLDVRSAVLPHLGPRLLAYVEPPYLAGGSLHLPLVASLDVGGEPGPRSVAAALENALRSVLAIYALTREDGGAHLRVESHTIEDVPVTLLGSLSPFAFAVGEGRLVLATSPESVARALAPASSDAKPAARLDQLRARAFPDAETFAWLDLDALSRLAETYREQLVKRLAAGDPGPDDQAPRDLDQVLAVMKLFQAAFASSTIDADFSAVHRA